MLRKALVCRRDAFFLLKILSFGKKCDEVVQMKSRGIRKVIFCKILTCSERAESQLSPKVSLTTICDLYLLLRVPDRWECFPSLRRSWCQFCCYFNIGTTEVEDSRCWSVMSPFMMIRLRYYCGASSATLSCWSLLEWGRLLLCYCCWHRITSL